MQRYPSDLMDWEPTFNNTDDPNWHPPMPGSFVNSVNDSYSPAWNPPIPGSFIDTPPHQDRKRTSTDARFEEQVNYEKETPFTADINAVNNTGRGMKLRFIINAAFWFAGITWASAHWTYRKARQVQVTEIRRVAADGYTSIKRRATEIMRPAEPTVQQIIHQRRTQPTQRRPLRTPRRNRQEPPTPPASPLPHDYRSASLKVVVPQIDTGAAATAPLNASQTYPTTPIPIPNSPESIMTRSAHLGDMHTRGSADQILDLSRRREEELARQRAIELEILNRPKTLDEMMARELARRKATDEVMNQPQSVDEMVTQQKGQQVVQRRSQLKTNQRLQKRVQQRVQKKTERKAELETEQKTEQKTERKTQQQTEQIAQQNTEQESEQESELETEQKSQLEVELETEQKTGQERELESQLETEQQAEQTAQQNVRPHPSPQPLVAPKQVRIALDPRDGLPYQKVANFLKGGRVSDWLPSSPWVEEQVHDTTLDFEEGLKSLKVDKTNRSLPPPTAIRYPASIATGETPTWRLKPNRHFTPPQEVSDNLFTTPRHLTSPGDDSSFIQSPDWDAESLEVDDSFWRQELPQIEEEAFTPERQAGHRRLTADDYIFQDSPSISSDTSHSAEMAGPLQMVAGPQTTETAGPLQIVAGPQTAERGDKSVSGENSVDYFLQPEVYEEAKSSETGVEDYFLELALETSFEYQERRTKALEAYDRAVAEREARAQAQAEELARELQAELNAAREPDTGRRWPPKKLIQPLSQEWQMKIDQAMARGENVTLATTLDGTQLTKRDFSTVLGPTSWLNDNIINAYVDWVVAHANKKAGRDQRDKTPKVIAQSSFFYKKISTDGPHSVSRWMRRKRAAGKSLLEVETMLIPVNNASHWTMIVVSPKARTLEYLDSFGGSKDVFIRHTKAWLAVELGSEWNEDDWRVLSTQSAEQHNGYDCGVFAITNAECVAGGITTTSYDKTDMATQRRRIAAVLLNGGFDGDMEAAEDM